MASSGNGMHSQRGAIALLGSGEYLDVMNGVDTHLLNTIGGAEHARVVLIPTASGLEPGSPTMWNDLGLRHFSKLGVKDVRPAYIIDRPSAEDPAQLALLEDANLYYFSGGNPQHCIESLRDTPAWDIIVRAYERGAVLAGCSAGAMMLAGHTLSLRKFMQGQQMEIVPAQAIIPNFIVFPHFDRMSGFIGEDTFARLLQTIPQGNLIVGIDENTALVRIEQRTEHVARWRVMGAQTVKIYTSSTPQILQVGDEIDL